MERLYTGIVIVGVVEEKEGRRRGIFVYIKMLVTATLKLNRKCYKL